MARNAVCTATRGTAPLILVKPSSTSSAFCAAESSIANDPQLQAPMLGSLTENPGRLEDNKRCKMGGVNEVVVNYFKRLTSVGCAWGDQGTTEFHRLRFVARTAGVSPARCQRYCDSFRYLIEQFAHPSLNLFLADLALLHLLIQAIDV